MPCLCICSRYHLVCCSSTDSSCSCIAPLHPTTLQLADLEAHPSSGPSATAKSGQSRRCLPSLIQLQHTSHHSSVSEAIVIVKFIANSSKYNHQMAQFFFLVCLVWIFCPEFLWLSSHLYMITSLNGII